MPPSPLTDAEFEKAYRFAHGIPKEAKSEVKKWRREYEIKANPEQYLGNVTHRDGLIIKQALAFAIAGLSATQRPQLSNIDDMKRILGFLLDLDVIETDDRAVLPPNWYTDQGLYEVGRLFRDTNREAMSKALDHVEAVEEQFRNAAE